MGSTTDRAITSQALWYRRFQRFLGRHHWIRALRLLDQVIEQDLPLLDLEREVTADRRVAWLCRIDLLREMGRMTEALAWACLECELHPDNAAAQALKEELKRQTRFGERRPPTEPPLPAGRAVVRWQGLAGMRQLRAELEKDVILPLLYPDRYRAYKVPLPNGLLLYGPPGCGKTFIARKLAEMVRFRFFDVAPSDLASIYVHGSQEKIRALFDLARKEAPAMLFFDEFDALVPRRDDAHMGHHYQAEVNEFLTQLNECAKSRLLVVAATNIREKIDTAVLRPGRIDKQFYVGPPDFEARVELLRLYLAGRPVVGVDYLALGEATENYTPAEIEAAVNEAARLALTKSEPIGDGHVTQVLSTTPPALGRLVVSSRKPIGF
jgi:transitional endoplasmic reticulum ATPase